MILLFVILPLPKFFLSGSLSDERRRRLHVNHVIILILPRMTLSRVVFVLIYWRNKIITY